MRYFFHAIVTGTRLPDLEGTELSSDAEAEEEARRYAVELAGEAMPSTPNQVIGIKVIDEAGHEVAGIGLTIQTAPTLGSLDLHRVR